MTADNVLFEIKGLKKNFGDLEVLKGIHTTIRKGEVVVVIGPSGSGKSTFIRCLNLLETPTAGSIYVDGAEIIDPKCDINLHRQKMGMVFQHFNLFPHMTILRNMTLAPTKLLKKSKADAEKKASKLISGLNADEKDELQEILGDRDKINAVLSSPAAQKIMEKLNGKKNGHQ